MKILSNTLKPLVERWDDPGDYPSGAGSGPLASRDFVADIEGQLVVEFTDADLDDEQTIEDWLIDNPGALPHDVPMLKVREWFVKHSQDYRATLEVAEFECDVPEMDYDE